MRFTKMHGAGNDYVYINVFEETLPDDIPSLAIAMSDRHKGIGADGLVLMGPSDSADAQMRMFNADGSEAEMCGNAIRCVGKYLHDHGIVVKDEMTIETGAGILTLELDNSSGKTETVRVNMGEPILVSQEIPTTLEGDPPVDVPLSVNGRQFNVTSVSMGNPHCVTFVDELSDDWALHIGPQVEHHPAFPNRVNAEFVEVISRGEVNQRTWERGSGETKACGTGACAVCVAGVLTGRTDRKILNHLPGGDLVLEWDEASNNVFMTGPATEVFSGEWL